MFVIFLYLMPNEFEKSESLSEVEPAFSKNGVVRLLVNDSFSYDRFDKNSLSFVLT